ncbi:hypothetical protein ACFWSF_00695 [Streptomyces sp. NPDC058611]|uniref:hypothetical protein n=1 Tax=unclassified Streptomyces TaxID=2593676 RepID=UPI00364C8685
MVWRPADRPTDWAGGPHDAAFLPRLTMVLRAPAEPVTEPVSKLGGQPVRLDEPCGRRIRCPVSGVRERLVFVGRFRVPGDEVRLAYAFLAEEGWDAPCEPEFGDAVVLVQPGGRTPAFAAPGPRRAASPGTSSAGPRTPAPAPTPGASTPPGSSCAGSRTGARARTTRSPWTSATAAGSSSSARTASKAGS